MLKKLEKYSVVLLCLCLVVSLTMSIMMWRFTIDDAFISFRYSDHLAKGHGLAWNIGEDPVEGYTNFLWVMIMALFMKININPVIVSKVIGTICSMLSVFMIYRIGLMMCNFKNRILPLLPAAIYSLTPFVGIHSISGLETASFSFWLLLILYLSLRLESKVTLINQAMLYGSFFISGLIRPEGILFSMTILAVFLIIKPGLYNKKSLMLLLLFFILPGILYMVWRVSYFGYFFPNTFYLKTAGEGALKGLDYVWNFIKKGVPVYMILLLTGTVVSRDKRTYLFIIPSLVYLLFNCMVEPMMGFFNRFTVPVYAMILIPQIIVLDKYFARPEHKSKFKPVLLSVFCVFLICFPVRQTKKIMKYVVNYSQGLDKIHISLGKILSKVVENPGDYTLVVGDAGAIPFYSKWNSIDSIGLNDEYIAHNGFDADYVYKKEPDVLILYSEDGKEASKAMGGGYDYALFTNQNINKYSLNGSLQHWKEYYLMIYFKKSLTDYNEILNKIKSNY